MNTIYTETKYIEVDAARLLLILNQFSVIVDNEIKQLNCYPNRPVIRYFTPEYKLQKLDFLVRYPTYFAYELIELHRLKVKPLTSTDEVIKLIYDILTAQEPDLRTNLYQKYLRGAYERLDTVESWWHSRELVYRGLERRGILGSASRPQKYYFLTRKGEQISKSLTDNVEHARWYETRIALIYKYFGGLSAANLKGLQYTHREYREAQLKEEIPDLPLEELFATFEKVFGTPLEIVI